MAVILNRLETQQDIKEYKEMLKKKSTYTLQCFIRNIERDMQSKNPCYVNQHLRIELISEEIAKRLN